MSGEAYSKSQCLNVVSDIENPLDRKARTPAVSDSLDTAELYLDTVVEGFMEQNYEKATQYTEEKFLVNFTKKEFKRGVTNSREDLGAYMHREFLGSLKGESFPDEENFFPDHVRYVWRGTFEKNEGLLIMGSYKKHDSYYTSDISCK